MDNPILKQEELVQTLRVCVDAVFATMVTSFKAAAVKNVESLQPRQEGAIRFRDDGADPCSKEVHEQVEISFSGESARGRVVLRCSVESADSIARGLLMMEESEALDPSVVRDALGECANMLAGSLKTKALDSIGTFKLGLPDFSYSAPAGEIEGELVYQVAEGVMSVEVWLD